MYTLSRLPAARTAVLVCCVITSWHIQTAAAVDITVGGDSGWAQGIRYPPLQGQVGDALVFNFRSGPHNVVELPSPTCSALGSSKAKTLAGTSDPTPVRIPLDTAGVRYFACFAEDQCNEGQIVQVTTRGSPAGVLVVSQRRLQQSQSFYEDHEYLQHVHAWLMGTVFIFLMPLAIVISRSWKGQNNSSIWFHLHWILQTIAVILAICGVVLGHYFPISGNLTEAHRILGIIAVAFAGCQVLFVALKPRPQKWIRKIWNLQHWWIGRAALVMGIVNFYIGVYIYYQGEPFTKAIHLYIAAAVILGTLLVSAILKDAYNYLRQPHVPYVREESLAHSSIMDTDDKRVEAERAAASGPHLA